MALKWLDTSGSDGVVLVWTPNTWLHQKGSIRKTNRPGTHFGCRGTERGQMVGRETEPALEQRCKVIVVKHTLTGEHSHAFRQMDPQKHHISRQIKPQLPVRLLLHFHKKVMLTHTCTVRVNKQSYQTASPRVFVIPLLAALFCVWLRLLLPLYLPSEKLNKNQQSAPSQMTLSASLYCVSLPSTLILLTEVKKAVLSRPMTQRGCDPDRRS